MTDTVAGFSRRAWIRAFAVALATLMVATLMPLAPAEARAPNRRTCLDRTNQTYRKLLECVTVDGVRRHQARFQQFADQNDDTRVSGTRGYDKSARYVARKLEDAGYKVTLQEFDFPFFAENTPAELQQLTPVEADYETGAFQYSGSGDVSGAIVPVDLALDGDRDSTSGCEPEDFDGVDLSGDSDVVLVQRGACAFGLKASNAQDAGAEAVIIFNQGNDPSREDLIVGTLGGDVAGVITIPVVGASFADGQALAADGATARVFTDTISETRSTSNVIAESRRGDADNVVMAGAHLDSVAEGPGINDNGSGSAGLLETALMMAKIRNPENKLRFAWWGAEESGLIGSTYYVDNLPVYKRNDIALYQNYDMIGSPNYVFQVYDADESTFAAADFGVEVPDGSVAIEDLYEQFYSWKGAPYDDTGFSGRSDYQAFIDADIPSGGLFTGAEEVKTEEQVAIWGGTAGDQFDPCYHLACDTFENNSNAALDLNSDAVAFSMLTYAYSTEDVNGIEGRRVPGRRVRLPEPAGAEGTFAEGDGGLNENVAD